MQPVVSRYHLSISEPSLAPLTGGHRSWFPITHAPGTGLGRVQSWASQLYILLESLSKSTHSCHDVFQII